MFRDFKPRLITTGYDHKIRRRLSITDLINHIYYRVKYPKRNKIIISPSAIIRYSQITVTGINNEIFIDDDCCLYGIEIFVRGDNNKLYIGKETNVNQSSLCGVLSISLKGDSNEIHIGDRAQIRGRADITAHSGTKIIIGNDFGMTADSEIRSGDGHAILDMNGNITNLPKDIFIGNNCWLGVRATIQKGVSLKDNTIVAKNAIVTKSFDESNIMIGGIPARLIKRGISWKFKV